MPTKKREGGVPAPVPWPTRQELWNRLEAEREVEPMLSGRGSEYRYKPMPERWVPGDVRWTYCLRAEEVS